MVQQLYSDIERLKAEVARLRGKVDSVIVGGQVIPGAITAGVQLPLPIAGAILYGTTVPDWARLAPPAAGDDYALKYLDGDNKPSWQSHGTGDDVFTINMGAAL